MNLNFFISNTYLFFVLGKCFIDICDDEATKGLNGSRGHGYRFNMKGCVITKQIVPKFRLGFNTTKGKVA
jgi:hypothetical protein